MDITEKNEKNEKNDYDELHLKVTNISLQGHS